MSKIVRSVLALTVALAVAACAAPPPPAPLQPPPPMKKLDAKTQLETGRTY
jgi:starvation-inducible outer membrane lipoprotein